MNLRLAGRSVLVVGGGAVAARKVDGLLEAGAVVHVVALDVDEAIRGASGVTVEERAYRSGEAAEYRLVVSATGDPAVDRQVHVDADEAGVWVNSADDPENCTFTLPASLRRGDLLVTVSTGGRSPAVSAWLRQSLETEIGPEYATLVEVAADVRETIRAAGRSSEGLDWNLAFDSTMLELVREGRTAEAKERLQACLQPD